MHHMRGDVGGLPSGGSSSLQSWHKRHAGSLPLVYRGAFPSQPSSGCLASMQAGEPHCDTSAYVPDKTV